MHAYNYMSERFLYTFNEVLQNINRCVINLNYHYIKWPVLCAVKCPFLSVNQLCSGIVDTGEVWTADILGSKDSGTHFVECYVSTVLSNVT
jgi:hypothetical protein